MQYQWTRVLKLLLFFIFLFSLKLQMKMDLARLQHYVRRLGRLFNKRILTRCHLRNDHLKGQGLLSSRFYNTERLVRLKKALAERNELAEREIEFFNEDQKQLLDYLKMEYACFKASDIKVKYNMLLLIPQYKHKHSVPITDVY